jgi:hypothetical protein
MCLREGFEVVNCDADAIIVQDFTGRIASLEGDLIISQGLGHPHSAFEQWGGFTLCCGFAVYRPSESTIELMKQVQRFESPGKYDDQTALNSTLLRHKLLWDKSSTSYNLPGARGQVTCFNTERRAKISSGSLAGLDVVLLPHAEFRRLPNKHEIREPLVFHPLPKMKGAAGVMATLKENHLWTKRKRKRI